MNIGELFTCKDTYSYNDDCQAFIECILLKDIGEFSKGMLIDEALFNLKSSKLKFSIDEKIYIIPLVFNFDANKIKCKPLEDEDSDFDVSDSDTDSEDEI